VQLYELNIVAVIQLQQP